jgi:hypothetical protein
MAAMSTPIAATLLQRPPLFLCVAEDPESLFRAILSVSGQGVYCVPPPAAETPTTICVPPSNWISCFAPSRMLEA